jgi:hypothetical protein
MKKPMAPNNTRQPKEAHNLDLRLRMPHHMEPASTAKPMGAALREEGARGTAAIVLVPVCVKVRWVRPCVEDEDEPHTLSDV